MAVDPAWVLAAMIEIQPVAPWRNTYKSSAVSIAKAAEKYPIFRGTDGEKQTAAWLVALGFYEGALKPDAKGDCKKKNDKGMCAPDGIPHSFCMFQIHDSNHASLGVTAEQLLTDMNVCSETAAKMMQTSFHLCKEAPLNEKLRQYAGGGGTCTDNQDAINKSKGRANKGIWIFQNRKINEKAKLLDDFKE